MGRSLFPDLIESRTERLDDLGVSSLGFVRQLYTAKGTDDDGIPVMSKHGATIGSSLKPSILWKSVIGTDCHRNKPGTAGSDLAGRLNKPPLVTGLRPCRKRSGRQQ